MSSAPEERAGLTRRALLGGAATAAGAASLLRPAAGMAAVPSGERAVFSRWVGTLAGESEPLVAPRPFALLGVEWEGPADAQIELRTRSRWAVASTLGHDGDGQIDRTRLFGEPIWTGPAERVQLRASVPVSGVRLHFVAPPPSATTARTAQAMALAKPVLDAGPGQPPIIARQAWARGHAHPTHAAEYGKIKLAFVHHSDTPNGYSATDVPGILLSIFDYHVYTRGFWDIAYNFAIDAFGRIWEARAGGIAEPVIGAQAGGYNAESTGAVVLGTFMDVLPSAAAVAALEHLLAWKLSLHGVPTLGQVTVVVDPAAAYYTPFAPGAHVSLPRVAGHRQGDLTDCPGNAFFGELPSIRPRIAALAGTGVLQATLNAPSTVTAGRAVVVSGRLTKLGGGGVGGAPLELQTVAEAGASTIAQTTTGANGAWSASLSLQYDTLLQVLHRPAPATVSNLVEIAVAPAVTLTLEGTGPIRVSGTVAPSKPHVTIDLYKVSSPGHRRLVKRDRVGVAGGSFHGALSAPGPGNYVLVARTAADAVSAGGASPGVHLTV